MAYRTTAQTHNNGIQHKAVLSGNVPTQFSVEPKTGGTTIDACYFSFNGLSLNLKNVEPNWTTPNLWFIDFYLGDVEIDDLGDIEISNSPFSSGGQPFSTVYFNQNGLGYMPLYNELQIPVYTNKDYGGGNTTTAEVASQSRRLLKTSGTFPVTAAIWTKNGIGQYRTESLTIINIGTVTVYPIEFNRYTLSTGQVQTEFYYNEPFNYNNLVVQKWYKYNSALNSASPAGYDIIYNYTVDSVDTSTTGTKTVNVHPVSNVTLNYTITVATEANSVNYISITDTNHVLQRQFYTNEAMSFSDLTIVVYYLNNNTPYPISLSNCTIKNHENNIVNYSNYTFYDTTSQARTLTFYYQNKSTTGTFNVTQRYPVSLSVSGTLTKALSSYIAGQFIDLSGITVTLTYNSGTTRVLTAEDNYYACTSTGTAKTSALTVSDDNTPIYIGYGDSSPILSSSSLGTLRVAPITVVGITVVTEPTKKSYTFGDAFDLTGLVVSAQYNNGTSSQTPINNSDAALVLTYNTNVALKGHIFNPEDDGTTFNTKAVTVTYTENGTAVSTTFNIELIAPELVGAVLSGNYKTVFNDQTSFNRTNMVVTGVFSNGWEYTIPETSTVSDSTVSNISDDAAAVIPIDNESHLISIENNNYGIKTITLTIVNIFNRSNTKTKQYDITVNENTTIVMAYMDTLAKEDTEYRVGDKYTAKGVLWIVENASGNRYTSNDFSTSIPANTILRAAGRFNVKVTFNQGNFEPAEYTIIVNIPNKVEFTEENTYKIAKQYRTIVSQVATYNDFKSIVHEEATINLGKRYGEPYQDENNVTRYQLIGEYYPVFHSSKVSKINNVNTYIGDDAEADCIGYMDMGLTAEDEARTIIRQAHLILWDDVLNPIEGQGNIEIKFPHYVSGNADKINKTKLGIIYNKNLFLSGNPDAKNCDWHSASGDITYFSDLDYCRYGSDDTAIVGYDIFRDGDLIVVKEGSRRQATLYRRTLQLTAAMSYDGNSTVQSGLVEESFPMFDINANGGDGGLSHRSILNYMGETLVLTKNGFKSLTTNDEIKNNAKYAVDVSSFINPKIKDEDLKDAFAFQFKEKLYLKTKRGVYVGYYSLKSDKEYEWYFISDVDADLFFEYDDELYFANNNGNIYRFPANSKKHIDENRYYVGLAGSGLATVDISTETDELVFSAQYANYFKNGRRFNFLGAEYGLVHAKLGDFIHELYRENAQVQGDYDGIITSEGVLEITNSEIFDLFYNGREIYCDQIVIDTITQMVPDKPFKLVKIEPNNPISHRFYIYDGENMLQLNTVRTFRMSYQVGANSSATIKNVDEENHTFELYGDLDKKLDLIEYNNHSDVYRGIITKEDNVKAFYVTVPYSFGSLSHMKTIWSWVVANDTDLASYMDVGYLTSVNQGSAKVDWAIETSSGSRELDFGLFNMEKVQFTSDLLPHIYVRYRTVPLVNFIRFTFANNKDSNMVLSALEVTYSISEFSRGSK